MTNAELYRQSLSALTPGEDWRERTLAAMESAAPRPARRRTGLALVLRTHAPHLPRRHGQPGPRLYLCPDSGENLLVRPGGHGHGRFG